ncbi:MAG: hypothetical protein ABIJ48_01810 [Actinomycetota bacterium]
MGRKYFWGALVIITMWVAVLIVGVIGEGEFLVRQPGGEVHIPVVWGVALFALIGSWVVAAVAFRDGPEPKKEETPPPPAA